MKTIRRLRYSIYAGILILLLVTISVATVMFVSSSGQDKLIKKVDRIAPQLMEQYKVPGAAMALVGDGEVVWSSGYGLADKDLGVPVIGDTVFQVASISKAVTSWGVMKLVENGRLGLDAPVEQYLTRWHLPPSDFDPSGVTIRRLLSHSAGLSVSGYPGLSPIMALPSLEESLSGNNGGAGEVRITMQPGAQFSYSGGGFTLLQLIIEEVTGETFSAYMQREVLDPLGMSYSSFEWRADLRPATAVAYSEWGSPLPNYLFTEQAAGLYTTAPDLARFVAAEMPGPHGEPAGRGGVISGHPKLDVQSRHSSLGLGSIDIHITGWEQINPTWRVKLRLEGVHRCESEVGRRIRNPHEQRQWGKPLREGAEGRDITLADYGKDSSNPHSRFDPGISDSRHILHQKPGFSPAALAEEARDSRSSMMMIVKSGILTSVLIFTYRNKIGVRQ